MPTTQPTVRVPAHAAGLAVLAERAPAPSPVDVLMLTNVRSIMGSRHPREAAQVAAISTSTVLLEEMRDGGSITAGEALFVIDATRGLARARTLELNETLAASLGRRWSS